MADSNRIKARLTVQLKDDLSAAKSFRLSSTELMERVRKREAIMAPKRTPQWVWWYLRGIHDATVDHWYRYFFEFVYVLDGVPHSTHDDSCLPRLPAMAVPKGTIAGHCWKVTTVDLDRVGGNLKELNIRWWHKGAS